MFLPFVGFSFGFLVVVLFFKESGIGLGELNKNVPGGGKVVASKIKRFWLVEVTSSNDNFPKGSLSYLSMCLRDFP